MRITLATIDERSGLAQTSVLDLPVGSTVKDALVAAGYDVTQESVAIYCQKATFETPLKEGDRIDIGTPLRIERSEARRIREMSAGKKAQAVFSRHGSKRQLQRSGH